MNRFKNILVSLAMALNVGFLIPVNVGAQSVAEQMCLDNPDSIYCDTGNKTLMEYVKDIINTLSMIIGVLAVVMIIYAGIMYITSAGEADKIKKAKNTLTYAIIGLVIALLAGAIVRFVLGAFE